MKATLTETWRPLDSQVDSDQISIIAEERIMIMDHIDFYRTQVRS